MAGVMQSPMLDGKALPTASPTIEPLQPDARFASDNTAPLCPEALAVLAEVSQSYASSYGEDGWTKQAREAVSLYFETDCDVFFCATGTAANALALAHCCASYESVICHELAHVEADECAAVEMMSHGAKLLVVPGASGKIRPESVTAIATRRGDVHWPRPRALSVTQPTELGTVYTVAELQALAEAAHRHELRFHMDGARFANAVLSLGEAPKAMTWEAGVDVLSFGAVKNGLALSEAVVFFNRDLARGFAARLKQAGQLTSKTRYAAAPYTLIGTVGPANAHNANEMARRLSQEIARLGQLSSEACGRAIELVQSTEANGVFCSMPIALAKHLRRLGWHFYDFFPSAPGREEHTLARSTVRLMTSWSTTAADVDLLLSHIEGWVREASRHHESSASAGDP